jgi:hypothetical protein
MRLLNFALFTPGNVLAIGAIIFLWGALAFFARDFIAGDVVVSDKPAS